MEFKNDIISKLMREIIKFRDQRDWRQFHNPKDLALAISIEAAELNELFLWKKHNEVNSEQIAEELSDVLIYSFLLAHESGVNIEKAIKNKLKANEKKYPVIKSKGNARKYTEF
ncbi:MAG: nucleotide pyrophosphohydrolase [Bacteroidota bacterium]